MVAPLRIECLAKMDPYMPHTVHVVLSGKTRRGLSHPFDYSCGVEGHTKSCIFVSLWPGVMGAMKHAGLESDGDSDFWRTAQRSYH